MSVNFKESEMKITFDRDVLIKELSIAQEVIATKTALTILSNILLIAKDDKLTMKATDVKVSFETSIPVNVVAEGSTTVFCDKLVSIILSLPQGEIEMEEKENKMIVRSALKKVKFQLKTISDDDFPIFLETEDVPFFELPNKDFKDSIKNTIFATSDDETRYFLNGIYIEHKNNLLHFVATDGRRLALVKKSVEAEIKDFSGIIVPPKVLNIIYKRLGDEGNISIGITEKNVFFKFNNYKFYSILIDGQYPNYERVIPENQLRFFEIDRKEFLEGLKRVSLMVEQKSKRVLLNISENNLGISSQESEIGVAREDVFCECEGEDMLLGLNYVYLEEPLKTLTTEKVRVEFTEPTRAIMLKGVGEENVSHVIMPMQV